ERAIHREGAPHVLFAQLAREPGLRKGRPQPADASREHAQTEPAAERARELERLVVAALAQPSAVQRYGDEGLHASRRPAQAFGELPRAELDPIEPTVVLGALDQTVEGRGVPVCGNHPLEGGWPLLAAAASPLFRSGSGQGSRATSARRPEIGKRGP